MSTRALTHVLTRPKVMWPSLIGLALVFGKVSLLFGVILMAVAVWNASRLLSDDRLEDLLRLRADKNRHGIRRLLYDGERLEIFAIDRYAAGLVALGADAALAQAALDEAWAIVARAGEQDATLRLRVFRESLPPLSGAEPGTPMVLADRIARELQILHATRREVESLG